MTDERENDVVERLEKLLEDGHANGFSSEEVIRLKKIARFYIAADTFGPPGRALLKILGYMAVMIVGWGAFKTGLGDILRSFING